MNANILILFYSRFGATQKMAEQIAEGVESIGARATLRTVASISPNDSDMESRESGPILCSLKDIEAVDGLILGSPTRFGNMAAPLKYFIDSTSSAWMSGTLSGKPGAVFTSTSSMHGGQEATLISMILPLLHHGMIVTGIPYSEGDLSSTTTGGTPYGASHLAGEQSDLPLSTHEINLCKALGKRVANLAIHLMTPNQ